jgi:glycosyltransferase involved in cell wall biosynthesis
MKILFLYTELADYFLKCCEKLSESAEVHIVRWPVNKEAPFDFKPSGNLFLYEKKNYTYPQLKQLVAGINPTMIVCSGWIDKDYLKIASFYYRKIPTIMSCDTRWTGSIKQYLALILSRIFLLKTFSHAWVPGEAQKKYVLKLGFRKNRIKEGFYCCDLPRFNQIYESTFAKKHSNLPKRFIYAGRYYEFKGVKDLWAAFIELQNESPSDWELWCLGAGDLEPVQHPKIKHFGFVQPSDLSPILEQSLVFILPSKFEPWGVVVQEYAASGFPLLLSRSVGAGEAFLAEAENGYTFAAGNKKELKGQLKKIMNLSPKELISMSERSHELAQAHTPYKWVNSLLEIYYESKKE